MKKAILVVSFGTAHRDTLEKTVAAIEGDLRAAFPDRGVFRAFTSAVILRKLAQRDGLAIDTVPQALERLSCAGFRDVILQPTYVLPGEEWDKLKAQALPFAERFCHLSLGAPLLTGRSDCQAVAAALLRILPPPEPGRAIVLMGHGNRNSPGSCYGALQDILGRRDICIAPMNGFPQLARQLKEQPDVTRVLCRPLMVVAGKHAKNDLAGDSPASWKSMLEALGYSVVCDLRGLGEFPEIRTIFTAHAKRAEQEAL